MNRFIIALACIMAAFSLSRCSSTSYHGYSFEVLRPAPYTLPSGMRHVLIASGVGIVQSTDSTLAGLDEETLEQITRYEVRMPSIECAVVNDRLNTSGFVQATLLTDTYTARELADSVAILCRRHNADAIIMLDRYNYTCDMYIESVADGDRCLTINSAIESGFSLLTPQGTVRSFDSQRDTSTWLACGYTNAEIAQQMPKYNEKYYATAEMAAENFVTLIVPEWEKANRYLLSANDRRFIDAIEWTTRDNWQNAQALWSEIYATSTASNKARAAINIALAYERADSPDTAAIWCSKALDILQHDTRREKMKEETDMADAIFRKLMIRIEEKKRLHKQMTDNR